MRILIIEDNEEINDILKEAVTDAGYEAVQSFSGSEGLLRFSTEDFDMVLLDLMLPGIKGEEVLQKIKEKSDIPVLVLSAKTDIEGKVNLLRQGASDYITKPFDVREVLARIDLHAKNSGTKNVSNDLIYNEISINEESHVCSVNGNEISLTKHEFNLLRLLVLHPEKVYSKRELFELAWEEEYIGEDNTVNVHISNIRKKIREYSDNEYIKAVWGIGFRI
ncbi:MAG: response regulator transcription factor [Lachnospiraceae bacterium]|nr:response regulator transcription factor [Lachnospiraceae bacterium]